MEWLYQELPRERHAVLQAHLSSCAQCESQVTAWKGAMDNLDGWSVLEPSPGADRARACWSKGAKWAAAAVLVITAFLLGRTNPTNLNAAVQKEVAGQMQLARAELATNLKQTLTTHFESVAASNRVEVARLFGDLAATINEGRAADQQNVLAALKEMDARWLAIYASFRRELETVAILTETGLKDTQQQLVQMTDFNQVPR
jgi:hypothetical protein